QDSQNVNPNTGVRWDTLNNTGSGGVFNSGSVNLIQDAGNGGTPYDLVTTLWSANPAGPATTTAEINTLINSTGHPSNAAIHLHGTNVQGDCGTSSNWKGLSCVSDT